MSLNPALGRQRQAAVSSRPAWSIKKHSRTVSYTEKPCLEKPNQTQASNQPIKQTNNKNPQKCQILIKDILFRNLLMVRSDFRNFLYNTFLFKILISTSHVPEYCNNQNSLRILCQSLKEWLSYQITFTPLRQTAACYFVYSVSECLGSCCAVFAEGKLDSQRN